jgi:hypothetical protein
MTRITDPEELRALHELDAKLRDFPGRTELRLIVWHEGEQPDDPVLSGVQSAAVKNTLAKNTLAKNTLAKNTLAHFRKKFGGNEGFLTDPRGDKHHVSLASWADDDPETTYVLPSFTFTPEESRWEEWKAHWREHYKRFPPRRSSKIR